MPRIAHIDDGGSHFARAWASVHDHADALAELLPHAFRSGALAGPADIGGCRGNRDTGRSDYFHCNAGSWHAQGDVAGVGRDVEWKPR